VSLVCGSCAEREKASGRNGCPGAQALRAARGSVPTAETGGIEYRLRRLLADRPVVAVRIPACWGGGGAKGPAYRECRFDQPEPSGFGRKRGSMPRPEGKSFAIPKRLVWEAWRQVRANKGAPGVDGQDLAEFEADLENNLYKVWNRMSSGTWFPPPVRAVEIPKPHGEGSRMLGVPTIADRVAQTTVAMFLEPLVEPRFHQDSYGYRPNVSAHDAIRACRARCWKYDWIIDLDVQKFLESSSHCQRAHGGGVEQGGFGLWDQYS